MIKGKQATIADGEIKRRLKGIINSRAKVERVRSENKTIVIQ